MGTAGREDKQAWAGGARGIYREGASRGWEVDWGKLVMGDFGPCGLMWVGGEEVVLGW